MNQAAAHPRMRARALQARGQRNHRRLRLVAVAVSLATLGWLIFGSSWLAVSRINVTGASGPVADEVRRAATKQLGVPLARVDSSQVQRDVEAALPAVRSARVIRSWPKTLRLDVTLRTPVLALIAGTSFQLVDDQGVPFAKSSRPPAQLPVVGEVDGKLTKQGVQAAAAAVRAVQAINTREITSLQISHSGMVTFTWGKIAITWGDGAATDTKAASIRALLRTNPRSIDVSAPGSPVTS